MHTASCLLFFGKYIFFYKTTVDASAAVLYTKEKGKLKMFRYDHIGQKIKLLAKIFFVSGTVAAVISGFIIMFLGDFMILLGLLIMAGGPFVAWGSSWMIYGFGVLVDKADASDPKSIPQQTTPQSDRIKRSFGTST